MHATAAQLGRHHFAYVRAVVQGVELRRAWRTYLAGTGGPDDERHFASELRRLHRLIRAAAASRGLDAVATTALGPASSRRAARRAAPSEPHRPPPLLSLEDWIAERCDEFGIDVDFQTQAEWAYEYQDAFGLETSPGAHPVTALALADAEPAPAAFRVDERVAALRELEAVLARRPALDDALEVWLSPAVALALRGRAGSGPGLLTLRNLIDFANVHGHRWAARVPGLGLRRAERLMAWLGPLSEGFHHPLKALALRPATQLALPRRLALASNSRPAVMLLHGALPLERLGLPADLDGSRGTFRAPTENTFGATTDLEAIEGWLRRYSMSPRTFVSYRRTAERFYVWCLRERRKPVSSLTEEDLHAWRLFMADPPAHWVQERHVARAAEDWRPFRGPLSALSQRHAFTVIAGMLGALREAGYLSANAARGVVPFLKLPRPTINKRRSFSEAQWHWVVQTWTALHAAESAELERRQRHPGSGATAGVLARLRHLRRTRLVLELSTTTGLRLLEMATARVGQLRPEIIDGRSVWMLDVLGKGSRARRVVVFDDVKALIDRHQQDLREAGPGYDGRAPLRELLTPVPGSPGHRAPGTPAPNPGQPSPAQLSPAAVPADKPGDQPLIGSLRLAPPRWRLQANGVLALDREAARQADRHGALDATALYQSLKRLFARAADRSGSADPPLAPEDFLRSSTHWLRHFFANNAAADGVPIQILRSSLGHADLKTTSVYVNPDEVDLAREMAKMRRRK